MATPCAEGDIAKEAKSMKNVKSCGIDNITIEYIKYIY
jgi:hypothetical protein